MPVRQTSIETYREIEANGLLSKRRWEIYSCIYYHGPMTANEVFAQVGCPTNQSGRFTELREMGVIVEVRERPCTITGHAAIEWATTNNLPSSYARGDYKSRKDLEAEICVLTGEIHRLRYTIRKQKDQIERLKLR